MLGEVLYKAGKTNTNCRDRNTLMLLSFFWSREEPLKGKQEFKKFSKVATTI